MQTHMSIFISGDGSKSSVYGAGEIVPFPVGTRFVFGPDLYLGSLCYSFLPSDWSTIDPLNRRKMDSRTNKIEVGYQEAINQANPVSLLSRRRLFLPISIYLVILQLIIISHLPFFPRLWASPSGPRVGARSTSIKRRGLRTPKRGAPWLALVTNYCWVVFLEGDWQFYRFHDNSRSLFGVHLRWDNLSPRVTYLGWPKASPSRRSVLAEFNGTNICIFFGDLIWKSPGTRNSHTRRDNVVAISQP